MCAQVEGGMQAGVAVAVRCGASAYVRGQQATTPAVLYLISIFDAAAMPSPFFIRSLPDATLRPRHCRHLRSISRPPFHAGAHDTPPPLCARR